MHFSIYKHLQKKITRGFTVIELLVVIAIMSAITTALVIRQNTWSDKLALNTQIYELALMLRQAQIYSLGVKQNLGTSGDAFNLGYGVAFQWDPTIDNNSFFYFADKDGNKRLGTGELLETKTLTRGVVVDKICGTRSGSEICSPDGGNIEHLYITFLRPTPQARVQFLNTTNVQSTNVITPAYIYLRSPSGTKSKIKVEVNGQISIIENP